MRSKRELLSIKSFIDSTYNSLGNLLLINDEGQFNIDSPLGYCFKYSDSGKVIYKIECFKIGIERTDFRVLMHEYGHIYLGHLDSSYEDVDVLIYNLIRDHRPELIDRINRECGITFADKLLDRVIDDPSLNHELHNIAMDMEVNTKILSSEDIAEMEMDITSVMPKYEEERLEYIKEHSEDEEEKKKAQKELDRLKYESKVKLVLPSKYKFKDGLDYISYALLIVRHLDKFIKMLVSIKLGGNGDTSGITSDDIRRVLGGDGSNIDSLSDLMDSLGMSDGKGGEGANGKNFKFPKDKDHETIERQKADEKRRLGKIRSSGGIGCSRSGQPDFLRVVDYNSDEVDMALEEVIRNMRHRVVKYNTVKDNLRIYNRGIVRSVIVPSVLRKVSINTDPKIVYLIDISGSMDTALIDRILTTIAINMKKLSRGLKYDIITWSTRLGEHIKDIDPRYPHPEISHGGGTSIAKGIQYFKDNYTSEAVLVVISDFYDDLDDWHEVESKMDGYEIYGFSYGDHTSWLRIPWANMKIRNFKNSRER